MYTTFVESASAVGPGLGGRATGKRYSNALHTGSAVSDGVIGAVAVCSRKADRGNVCLIRRTARERERKGVYIVTNYHAIYDNNADETANGGKTAKELPRCNRLRA